MGSSEAAVGWEGLRGGKSFGDILLYVRGWVSQEAGPETSTQNVSQRGSGLTSGDGKQDQAEEEGELQSSHQKDCS